VAANAITELSFWARNETGTTLAWRVIYSDATSVQGYISTTTEYQKFFTTGLDQSKTVATVGVFGNNPPDAVYTTFVDDWTLTTTVPEPSSVVLLASALLPLAYNVRRRRHTS